ncbi:MAG: PDZ domain-containing protein [Sphingobium sp.]|nr:PDZ domain-containing protein [Sphingobium sp.]
MARLNRWMALPRWRGRIGGRSDVQPRWPQLLEYALIALMLVQLVALLWLVVTPVGPFGQWQGKQAVIADASTRSQLLGGYDLFYPSADGATGPQNITSLALKLYGVRINEGSGLGSAIIAGSDEVQNSYAVGDEIAPGVMLKSVSFDHVVITHNGAEESIFLDQSGPVEPVAASTPATMPADDGSGNGPGAASAVAADNSAEALKSSIGFGPRMSGGRLTGIVVARKGAGFDAAGFRAGDVITQINGRPISSASDLAGVQQAIVPGARISVMVERGAQIVPLAIMVQ